MNTSIWTQAAVEKKELVIIGAGEFAEIAFEYFTHDSPYEVVAFSVERDFLDRESLCGRPVVPFESLGTLYPPSLYSVFVAVTYTKLNRVRGRLYRAAKAAGYDVARYVSSRAFVWHNASIGENVFLFEDNVIQHRVTIGNNAVLWSGNHVGHRSVIENDCYLASHVVISGYCRIGASSFVGVNATVADQVTIGRDCLIGAGAIVLKNVPENTIVGSRETPRSPVPSRRFHKIAER